MKRYVVDVIVSYDNLHEKIYSKSFIFFNSAIKFMQRFEDEANILTFNVYNVVHSTSFKIYSCEV